MALEDKNNKVKIYNLTEIKINSIQEMNNLLEFANKIKTKHNTIKMKHHLFLIQFVIYNTYIIFF